MGNAAKNEGAEQKLLYITYTSANQIAKLKGGPKTYAKRINPHIKSFVRSSKSPSAFGCVIMDFIFYKITPRDIYSANF